MPDLHYITVATKAHPMLELLQKTVALKGERIDALGIELNRSIGWQSHCNFGIKLKLVREYIQNPDLKDDDILLFSDAFDILYIGNKDEIVKRYESFQTPIVFGAETNCSPDPAVAERYPDRNRRFPYLNSGLYIGRVWAFRELHANYSYQDGDDDQRYWTAHFLARPDLIALDYNNVLFLNCFSLNPDTIHMESDTLVRFEGADPLFLHFNGSAKDCFLDRFRNKMIESQAQKQAQIQTSHCL